MATIGVRAFEGYNFGGNANFPAVVSIGARAFANAKCSNLGLGKAETVGGEAFRDMDGSITADFTKVTSFGTPYEWFGSNVLKDVFTGVTGTINASLGDMASGVYQANGVSVFSGYTGTLNASFASGGTIAPYAFYGYAGSLTGDFSNVVSIGDCAFQYFSGTFIGEMDLKNAVSVGVSAFSNFTGKIKGEFPNLETVGETAFWDCLALPETVEFPKIQVIGAGAFSGTPIRNATFGPELRTLGEFIFDTTEGSLSEVHFQGTIPPYLYPISWHWLGGNYQPTTAIYVPQAAFDAYQQAWGDAPWWNLVSTE